MLLLSLVWNPCLKRQPEIREHSFRPVVNPLFEHLGPLAHFVHRGEIAFEKTQDFQQVEGDRHLRFALHLHRVDGRQAARDHCPQRVDVEVAEVESVRPRLMEPGVKPPNFRYQVNLTRVVILRCRTHKAVYHFAQAATARQLVRGVQIEESAEVCPNNLAPAELVKYQVAVHGEPVYRWAENAASANLVAGGCWPSIGLAIWGTGRMFRGNRGYGESPWAMKLTAYLSVLVILAVLAISLFFGLTY
jgi:hypothetical protein